MGAHLLLVSLFLQAPDIAEAEKLAVEKRRELKSGEVVIVLKYSSANRPNPISRTAHIWWDGTSFRQDIWTSGKRDIDVWTGDKYIRWSDRDKDSGRRMVVTYAFANDKGAVGDTRPCDPRRIGLVASDFLSIVHYPLDYVLTNPARRNTSQKNAEYDGVSCTLVTITKQNGTIIRAWIAPDRGYNLLKLDGTVGTGDSWWNDRIEMKVEQIPPRGIWFPTHYHYVRRLKDADEEEEGSVQVVSLNEPIPEEVFTLKGIGVPPGWTVSDHTRPDINTPLAWDGTRIVSATKAEREIEAAWRLNVFYVAAAIALALISAVLFWRFLSARASTP